MIPARTSDIPAAAGWQFADLADMFADVPIVLRARIAEATVLKDSAADPRPAGHLRFYIVADVTSLIRGQGGIAPRIGYVVDLPAGARGKVPRLKKADVLIAALPVPGRPAEIRLAARDAQLAWSAGLEARVRGIVAAALADDAPPIVTGVSGAFHVPGTIKGEGETQLFLATVTRQPVSLSVLRRPDMAPHWAMALGEIVDEAAAAPQRDTLAWYRLACFLPPALPAETTGDLAAADAEAARADYGFVIEQLGPCKRTRAD